MIRYIVLLVSCSLSLSISATPQYPITMITSLCEAAAVKENYSDDLASAAFPLVLDSDGWMNGGSRELSHEFIQSDLKDLKRFRKMLKKEGIDDIYIALVPPRTIEKDKFKHGNFNNKQELINAYRNQLTKLNSIGFMTSDLSQGMSSVEPAFYFKRDIHWRPEGAKVTAENIANKLSKGDLLEGIPAQTVSTYAIGMNVKSSSFFDQAMYELCGYKLPTEHAVRYETTPDVEIDLLSESLIPDIALIGTSYSANDNYHFDNFLKHALQRDVLNYAIAGGGEYGSWLNYFQARGDNATTPKIVVWELPSYSNPASYKDLRQIIPLANNGCEESESITTFSSKTTHRGKKEIIFDDALFDFKASELIMDIQTNDPLATSMEFRVWFESGFNYDFSIDLIDPATADGRFVFELANKDWDYRGKVLAIDLLSASYSSETSPLTLQGKICRNSFRG
ncbi:hypothetical protein H2O73_18575 [Vibrio sp. 404]|uniref:Alginate biosynthesis protein AlgX n=1 Tax=Vibrio marinisediminis TaxID=2758441 RepID=A0A7W2IVE7_9VIBR|nr:alginate biosynthesis protein AlgX [Vibrio marinisediminis]MBA5764364.1 hypothetical protein [Vibrio marinisediminis]